MGVETVGSGVLALVAMCFCGTAGGASRNATTSVGVRVERHTGLYLPGSSAGVSLASLREQRLPDQPRAFGNSESSRLVSGERPADLSRVSSGGTTPRLIVTAFEP